MAAGIALGAGLAFPEAWRPPDDTVTGIPGAAEPAAAPGADGAAEPGAAAPEPAAAEPAAALAITAGLLPDTVEPGETVIIAATPADAIAGGRVEAFERTIPLRRAGDRWLALLGVDYRLAPGEYPVDLVLADPHGGARRFTFTLAVTPKEFPVSRIRTSSSSPSVLDQTQWRRDRERVADARRVLHPDPLWSGPFMLPLDGPITSGFGEIRYVNDQEYGRHSGIDIAAPRGTPVVAAASGRVILAEGLYITGNTVIIDHGLGLTSSYSHLDRITVRVGEELEAGAVVGTVGATGFATGPHLHWAMSLHGVFVNPWPFLEESPLDRR